MLPDLLTPIELEDIEDQDYLGWFWIKPSLVARIRAVQELLAKHIVDLIRRFNNASNK